MSRSSLPSWLQHALVRKLLTGLVVAVLFAVLVPALAGAYWTRVLSVCAIFAIAAAGVGVLYGRLGLVSIMQVGLLAVGGWITLRVWHLTHVPFEIALLVAAVGTGIIGVLVGLPALRLSGLSLAIVTLMVAGALEVLFTFSGFPNGGDGFLGRAAGGVQQVIMPRPALGLDDASFFRYVVAWTALIFAVFAWHLHSRPGRAWAAIRQSEAGAIAAGISTTGYRLWALALVSATTGVAGALLAANAGLLDPISFRASQSILLFATVLIGGTFSLWGAIIAGVLVQGVPPLLDAIGVDGNLIFVVLGIGLVHAIMTAQAGIAGQLGDLLRRGLARVRRGPRTAGTRTPAAAARPGAASRRARSSKGGDHA